MRDSKRENLLAFLAYLVLAVVMTWPLIARLGTHVPMGNADVWLNYWNLWWWKVSLLEGKSPYRSDMIFFPTGAPLGLHTHSPANMIWTLPVNALFGMGPALNLAVFAGFVLAGIGGFLLAREYTRGALPAFLGGIACAYFPQHVDQATEHLNLASYWAMPLFVWALVRCIRHGGKIWWVGTGLFFALNALFAWHNALLSIPLGMGVSIFEIWRGPRPVARVAVDLARAAGTSALIVAPFFWPVLRDSLAEAATVQKRFYHKPIDPLTMLLPHSGHPLWGSRLTDIHLELRSYRSVGGVGYLGLVTVLLSICALVQRSTRPNEKIDPAFSIPRGATLFWLATALFFLILAMGETINTHYLQLPGWIHLPYYWLKQLPIFGLVRIPNRFLVPAMLALAVLAAMGADGLGRRFRPRGHRILIGALGLLMLLDYAWLPFPTRVLPRPQWPEQIEDLPSELAILDIPLSHGPPGAFEIYLQTLHGRPIVGGYLATTPPSAHRQMSRYPGLWIARTPRRPNIVSQLETTLSETVREMGVGLVVVHYDRTRNNLKAAIAEIPRQAPNYLHRIRLFNPRSGLPEKALTQIRRELRSEFGEPILRSPTVEVYRISSSTKSP